METNNITAADLTASSIAVLRDQAAARRDDLLESACDHALSRLADGAELASEEWASDRKVAMIVHAINTARAA